MFNSRGKNKCVKKLFWITGANGEIGHGLIMHLKENENIEVLALDVQQLDPELQPYCHRFIQGDILDSMLLGRLVAEYEIRTIYHLASILSTKAEYNPEAAHRVNVEGTLNLLRLAVEQARWQGRSVKFLYPSSIAAYGLPRPGNKKQSRQDQRTRMAETPPQCMAATSSTVNGWDDTIPFSTGSSPRTRINTPLTFAPFVSLA